MTALAGGATGCSAPPSAVPLMRVARQAMQQQTEHLEQSRERQKQQLEQRQAALKAGFKADLKQRDELTADWVLDGTAGYVAAREAVLRQHFKRRVNTRQRIDNLKAAMRAQDRAVRILQKQDRLLTRTLGGDLWDLRALLDSDQP
jgi:hypothetical protein